MNPDQIPEPFADLKIQAALNIVVRYCHARGIRRLNIEPPIRLSPANPFPTEWSHLPKRHDPNPAIAHNLIPNREAKAIDHARQLAIRWSEENDFSPPLHQEAEHNVRWHVVHHPECTCQAPGRHLCDCDFLVLTRYANREFSVSRDGSLEPFKCPPFTIRDFWERNPPPFFLDYDEAVELKIRMLGGNPISFVAVGEGESARILEFDIHPNPKAADEK